MIYSASPEGRGFYMKIHSKFGRVEGFQGKGFGKGSISQIEMKWKLSATSASHYKGKRGEKKRRERRKCGSWRQMDCVCENRAAAAHRQDCTSVHMMNIAIAYLVRGCSFPLCKVPLKTPLAPSWASLLTSLCIQGTVLAVPPSPHSSLYPGRPRSSWGSRLLK